MAQNNLTEIYELVRQRFNLQTSNLLKNFVHLNRQFCSISTKKNFLLRCRAYDVVPKHISGRSQNLQSTHFYSYSQKIKFIHFYKHTMFNILNHEISDIHTHLRFLNNNLNQMTMKINFEINDPLITQNFFNLCKEKVRTLMSSMKSDYINKFNRIISNKQSHDNKHNSSTNSDSNNKFTQNSFKNLTNLEIPKNVVEIVSLGPKFNKTKNHIDKKDAINIIKNVEYGLRTFQTDNDSKQKLKSGIIGIIKNNSKNKKHISREERIFNKKIKDTYFFKKQHPDIMFTNSDKGAVTVCIYTEEYKKQMNTIFHDKSVYKSYKINPLNRVRNNISEILTDLNNKKFLHISYHKNALTMTNKDLPRAYGLPKIHKPTLSFRPVISTINSPNNFLSNIILNVLKKCILPPKSCIKNSQELISKVKNLQIPNNYILFSLDVTSLFTNVSKELVLDSLYKRFSKINSKCKIPFSDLISCVEVIFDNTYFSFDKHFYKQIYGTPMGSPISPLFADLVMEDLEVSCLYMLKEECNNSILFYYRYVDDLLFCAHADDVNNILSVFNSYDNRIKFTHELQTENGINFLDVNFKISQNKLSYNWYQKTLSSGRFLNYNSAHPTNLKINMVYNITDRCILNSEKSSHKEKIELIKNLLKSNSYPPSFYNTHLNKRLRSISLNDDPQNKTNVNNSSSPSTTTLSLTISLPFINKHVYNQFKKLLSKFNINLVSKTDNKLNNIIILGKDKFEPGQATGVIYLEKCLNCTAVYAGYTLRQHRIRHNEHIKKKNKNSEISLHMDNLKHNFDKDCLIVLDQEKSWYKARVSEALHIRFQRQNAINIQKDAFQLSQEYNELFSIYK